MNNMLVRYSLFVIGESIYINAGFDDFHPFPGLIIQGLKGGFRVIGVEYVEEKCAPSQKTRYVKGVVSVERI